MPTSYNENAWAFMHPPVAFPPFVTGGRNWVVLPVADSIHKWMFFASALLIIEPNLRIKKNHLLKAHRPHLCNYPHMPTDYKYTEKCFGVLMVQTGELGQTDRTTDTSTNGHTLPNLLSPCFAKASWSIKILSAQEGQPCWYIVSALSLWFFCPKMVKCFSHERAE